MIGMETASIGLLASFTEKVAFPPASVVSPLKEPRTIALISSSSFCNLIGSIWPLSAEYLESSETTLAI